MASLKDKKKKPSNRKKFGTLNEMDLHILTEKFGEEEAGQIMGLGKSLGKFYRTSKIKHSA